MSYRGRRLRVSIFTNHIQNESIFSRVLNFSSLTFKPRCSVVTYASNMSQVDILPTSLCTRMDDVSLAWRHKRRNPLFSRVEDEAYAGLKIILKCCEFKYSVGSGLYLNFKIMQGLLNESRTSIVTNLWAKGLSRPIRLRIRRR